MNENHTAWEKIYETGWGNRYPDSTLISIFYRFIKPQLKLLNTDTYKVLDFACSLGANSKFFNQIGFETYGLDISETAIRHCIELNGFPPEHFKCCDVTKGEETIAEMFGEKFDLIIASECLYYLTNDEQKKIFKQFSNCLKRGGLLYIAMASSNSSIYKNNDNTKNESGMVYFSQTGTAKEGLWLNLISNPKELEAKLSDYQTKFIGRQILQLEDTLETIYYVGQLIK